MHFMWKICSGPSVYTLNETHTHPGQGGGGNEESLGDCSSSSCQTEEQNSSQKMHMAHDGWKTAE